MALWKIINTETSLIYKHIAREKNNELCEENRKRKKNHYSKCCKLVLMRLANNYFLNIFFYHIKEKISQHKSNPNSRTKKKKSKFKSTHQSQIIKITFESHKIT